MKNLMDSLSESIRVSDNTQYIDISNEVFEGVFDINSKELEKEVMKIHNANIKKLDAYFKSHQADVIEGNGDKYLLLSSNKKNIGYIGLFSYNTILKKIESMDHKFPGIPVKGFKQVSYSWNAMSQANIDDDDQDNAQGSLCITLNLNEEQGEELCKKYGRRWPGTEYVLKVEGVVEFLECESVKNFVTKAVQQVKF